MLPIVSCPSLQDETPIIDRVPSPAIDVATGITVKVLHAHDTEGYLMKKKSWFPSSSRRTLKKCLRTGRAVPTKIWAGACSAMARSGLRRT
jgi:hypothetical protein